jgi:hypothetical protein
MLGWMFGLRIGAVLRGWWSDGQFWEAPLISSQHGLYILLDAGGRDKLEKQTGGRIQMDCRSRSARVQR